MSVFIGPSPKVPWKHERIIEQELASIAWLRQTVADMLLCFLRSFLFLLLTLNYLATRTPSYCTVLEVAQTFLIHNTRPNS
jgi:hypothetical protein